MDFSKKNVLLTGPSHGIGTAFAKYFAQRGARLILIDIDAENLKKVKDGLPAENGEHISLVKDLSKHEDRLSIFERLQSENIELDVLVNNVGIGYCSLFHETPWERIERVIDVNTKGTAHLVWLFLPQMRKRNSGLIINLSSTGAFCGANRSAAYTGTKAFVTNFTEAIDMELMGTDVRTLTAHPGATDTNFWEDAGTTKMAFYKTVKMMSPEDTVEEFMNALLKGKKFIIAGWKNRLMVFLARFIPREFLKRKASQKYK